MAKIWTKEEDELLKELTLNGKQDRKLQIFLV